MDVQEAINERRAYRSLDPVEINEELVRELAESARLAPSCFNNQPWRFVFVYDPPTLQEMHTALSKGNAWAHNASMIIAAYSKPEYDCIVRERQYYLFDTGMATAFLILRATELGLVAHPIAGFREKRVKRILGIPDEMRVITLIILGKHSRKITPVLSEKQVEAEETRPERLPIEEFAQIK
jgi:nitroreductase